MARGSPGQKFEKGPQRPEAGRARRDAFQRYCLIRYVRSPRSDLKDSTVYPAFFITPAMNPRTVCFCQPVFP
jgi:hypothetical protein